MSLYPGHEDAVKEAYGAARTLGLTIIPVMARTPDDLVVHLQLCTAKTVTRFLFFWPL
jgi:hypothetical protein